MNGFLCVLKPPGMTSSDVVVRVRRRLPKGTKVGHAGTLDPEASGVLPLMVGKASRLFDYIVEKEKTKMEKASKKKAEKEAKKAEESYDDTPTFDYEEELGPNTYAVKARASVKETVHHIPKAVTRRIKEKKEAERLAEERRKANSAGKKKKK